MEEEGRIKVPRHINGDDAPSLAEWTGGVSAGSAITAFSQFAQHGFRPPSVAVEPVDADTGDVEAVALVVDD
jgi:hypothetical protein